jgi:hemolysin III
VETSHQYLTDGGPMYAETDLHYIIVEPWNAISSLAIVLPAVFWAVKLKFDYRKYPFLFFAIPLLVLGGLGSTFYHAFRSSSWLLYMDVAPTALLTFSVGVYFWLKVVPKWWHALLIIVPATAFRFFVFDWLKGENAVNISYFITGTLIFLPILIYLIRHKFRYYKSILISVVMLSLSLVFREMDQRASSYIYMGTHFLWHIFSGVGAYYLGKYLFLLRREEIATDDAVSYAKQYS